MIMYVLLGVALVVGLYYVVAKLGTGRWHDWDRRERRAMHREDPVLPDRSRALAQAMLLVSGLVAVALAGLGLAVGELDGARGGLGILASHRLDNGEQVLQWHGLGQRCGGA